MTLDSDQPQRLRYRRYFTSNMAINAVQRCTSSALRAVPVLGRHVARLFRKNGGPRGDIDSTQVDQRKDGRTKTDPSHAMPQQIGAKEHDPVFDGSHGVGYLQREKYKTPRSVGMAVSLQLSQKSLADHCKIDGEANTAKFTVNSGPYAVLSCTEIPRTTHDLYCLVPHILDERT